MAQQVKASAVQLDDLSLTLGPDIGETGNGLWELVPMSQATVTGAH